jgi:hypothetical protein
MYRFEAQTRERNKRMQLQINSSTKGKGKRRIEPNLLVQHLGALSHCNSAAGLLH